MDSIFKKCRHPHVSFFYFFVSVCICIAVKNPFYTLASFAAALLMNLLLENLKVLKNIALLLPFFVFLSCLNPLVSHWGETVLFNLFGDVTKPFTLEAFCYGLNTAFMLLTVVLWFMAFSRVITGDKLTFIFGRFFPATAIMFVMILRMIPFYRRRFVSISEGRKGLGLEVNGTLRGRVREKMHVLEAVTASTLEDGKFTAMSMENRGWGRGKRSSFVIYRFRLTDMLLLLAGLGLTGFFIAAVTNGAGEMSFYPVIDTGVFRGNFWNCAGLTAECLFLAVFTAGIHKS